MQLQIPAVCLLCSVLIIGICIIAKGAAAQSSKFGCYKVTAKTLNLRKRAWGKSDIVDVLERGDIVAKRRRFCAIRGFWCPVRTEGDLSGWADKKFLRRVSCPA